MDVRMLVHEVTQSKDMKRFKDNMKEEEKLAVKKVEVSVSKPERKVAVNQAKLELQAKRMDKVGLNHTPDMPLIHTLPHPLHHRRLHSVASNQQTWKVRSSRSSRIRKRKGKHWNSAFWMQDRIFAEVSVQCQHSGCQVIVLTVQYVGHTSSLWEKEQRQKQDHNQLQKQQLREAFHMQRHQMHIRHQIVRRRCGWGL